MKKKLKIFNYPWHIGHQYELMKIPNTEWTWLVQHRRGYAEMPRGKMLEKYDVKWTPHYEEGKYDLAILHIDQQCLEEKIMLRGKGSVYKEVNEVITDIPKIVIMHGTPFYPEMFKNDITKENYKELGMTEKQIGMSSELINKCKEVVGDNIMISNSKRATEQWGFGGTIIHGLDADEWWDLPKEPRVVTMISPAGLDKYYDRTFLAAIKEVLNERDIEHCHITVDANFRNWDEYRTFLGRSLIYLNPTLESPMPRSRTEAMLSGCCVLTTPHHDADSFIKNGENGFIIPRNPHTVADLIEGLMNNYDKAVKIGQEGKKTALKTFSADRYREDWKNLINKTLGREAL